MKKRRYFIRLIMILSLVFTTSTSALAMQKEKIIDTFEINEYDVWMELQSSSDNELEVLGYSSAEIKEIREIKPEEILLERAKLPEEELRNMGYDAERIEKLKAYDGSSLKENIEARALLATLAGSMNAVRYSRTEIASRFIWSWNSKPAIMGTSYKDMVVCGFKGTNSDSIECVVTVNESTCTVKYYIADTLKDTLYYTVNEVEAQSFVSAKFPTEKQYGGDYAWAKSGNLLVSVELEAPAANNLESVLFTYAYGHSTVKAEPSVSVSYPSGIGFNVTFSSGTEKWFNKSYRVKYNGGFTIFD